MMLFESLIFNLLPAAVGIMAVVLVFESCWRKCPPDKLMIVSGAGKMRSVSGKGTFVIPLLQRVDTLSLGAVQVQLTTENDIPTQDAILIHACAVANFQIGQTPELIETASRNYLNLDKEEMTRQVTEVMLGKMREVIGQMDLKELMRDRESFNAKVFGGSKDDLANLGLELRTFNVQDFSDSQGIIRSMGVGADQAAEIKKEAELAQIKAAEEVAIRQNQLDLKQADLKKQADKAKAEADMVKATVTAEKQRELYIAQQEAEIAAETKKVELAERQADVRERELNATVKKQAEAARIERQNQSDAELYSAQKDAEGIQARAKAEAEATRLKGESEGVAEKAHGEGVAAGIKAQAEAYNSMDNPYLLANRYIDIMPKVAEQVAKPLTAVDSIKMYGSGNAQKLVKETTSIVDQVASGLKDSTGIDLPSLLNGLISNPDIDADSAENSVE